MIYSAGDIRHVHLEISSRCNARCPGCPRNLNGYPYNRGYVEHDMTLAEAQTIFQPEFLEQLTHMSINGNLGDCVMNPDTVAIVRYFLESNPNIGINISTNGGARDRAFWTDLAGTGVEIFFCIDGLEDTHHLYRQNTSYATVVKNAQTVIAAGGRAVWKMIEFDHNTHQIAAAEQSSKELGFERFFLQPGRFSNDYPVYSATGELLFVMGKPWQQPDLKQMIQRLEYRPAAVEMKGQLTGAITCEVKAMRSVYIDSTGHVYPCCHMGFNPKLFNRPENYQFRDFVKNNSALESSLAECIEWFDLVEKTWDKKTFAEGRLKVCNDACGHRAS
jgi:MoaA/NifB/PqqE/SkfB family radical SAM enzyme